MMLMVNSLSLKCPDLKLIINNLYFVLSKNHTHEYGTRSLDILHVGSALTIKAETFLTLDARQSQLSEKSGLMTINPVSAS